MPNARNQLYFAVLATLADHIDTELTIEPKHQDQNDDDKEAICPLLKHMNFMLRLQPGGRRQLLCYYHVPPTAMRLLCNNRCIIWDFGNRIALLKLFAMLFCKGTRPCVTVIVMLEGLLENSSEFDEGGLIIQAKTSSYDVMGETMGENKQASCSHSRE